MGGGILAAMAYALNEYSVKPAIELHDSRSWSRTPCRIVASQIVHVRRRLLGREGQIRIKFAYEFQGTSYVGDRYDFQQHSRRLSTAQCIVTRLPSGSATFCWVNPRRPEAAVIERSGAVHAAFGMVVYGGLAALGGLMLFGEIRGAFRNRFARLPKSTESASGEASITSAPL
jgi:hypothetical protein